MLGRSTSVLLALGLAGLLILGPAGAAPASAAVANQGHPGDVLALEGTPNLWILDEAGVAHFVADTQAVAGKDVHWGEAFPVTLAQLQTMPRGEPWVAAPFVRIGEAIYVPQFADGRVLRLLHVQSPSDLMMLGITEGNYGQFVLDAATWEALNGAAPGGIVTDEFRLYEAPPEPVTEATAAVA